MLIRQAPTHLGGALSFAGPNNLAPATVTPRPMGDLWLPWPPCLPRTSKIREPERDVSMRRVGPREAVATTLLGGLLAVALALVPNGASAQSYSVTLEPFAYEPLPIGGGTATNVAVQGWGWTPPELTVTLDFPVEFYGQQYTQMNILGMGMVTFGPAE